MLILCVFKLIAILVVELSKTVIVLIDTCVHTDVDKIVGILHLKKEKPTIVTEIT